MFCETAIKTLIDVTDGAYGQTGLMDTVSWRGSLWLVPKWQQGKTARTRRPVRVVRPLLFHFARQTHHPEGADYTLSVAVPKAILDGLAVSDGTVEFEVVEAPEIESQIPSWQ